MSLLNNLSKDELIKIIENGKQNLDKIMNIGNIGECSKCNDYFKNSELTDDICKDCQEKINYEIAQNDTTLILCRCGNLIDTTNTYKDKMCSGCKDYICQNCYHDFSHQAYWPDGVYNTYSCEECYRLRSATCCFDDLPCGPGCHGVKKYPQSSNRGESFPLNP